jgi:hypothetical protein
MRWVGWYRRREGEPWQRACEGDTLAQCSRRLTEATRQMNLRSINYFMTGGAVPNLGVKQKEKAR